MASVYLTYAQKMALSEISTILSSVSKTCHWLVICSIRSILVLESKVTSRVVIFPAVLPDEISPYVDLVMPKFGNSPVNCQDFPQRPFDAGFICFT